MEPTALINIGSVLGSAMPYDRTWLIGLVVLLVSSTAWAGGRFLPGDSVRDRGRAGASVTSERNVNAMQVNPALLGMADNFGFALGYTSSSESGEFERTPPFVQSVEDQAQFNADMAAGFIGSRGLAKSRYADQLLRAGLVYGFGTSGFRIGLGYAQLPVENHAFSASDAQRYRLIRSADERDQISFGLAGAFGRRFALGLGLHWERLRRVRRLMINTTPATVDGNFMEQAANDHMVDITGTVPIGFGDSPFVPTASVGLWSRLFYGFEMGFSVALGGTGTSTDGRLDVLDLVPRDADDATSPVFARRGVSETSDGTDATLTDGSPLQIRAGMRYQFDRWDLEFEWRMESWSADSQLNASPAATGVAWFGAPAEESETGTELGNLGDGRAMESSMSFHLGSDIWLVRDGVALRFGASMENPSSLQPDAALFGGVRYGGSAGLTLADRGYSIDLAYYHLFSQASEVTTGNLPLRNMAAAAAEADLENLTVQNNGRYTTSHGFFGVGVRADVDVFANYRKSQRKAWYQVWSQGNSGFGREGF